jgi:HEAT repeat protein
VSILEGLTPDELANRLEAMKPSELRRTKEWVVSLLHHKHVIVRWAAAQALGRARIGAEALRSGLGKERNELVLTEITESLASFRDDQSLPQLRDLAEGHPSPIVRSYACMAVADIARKGSVPYLQDRFKRERSSYVKAALSCVLLAQGVGDALVQVVKYLESKNIKIRRLAANLLFHYAPRKGRHILLTVLREVLSQETDHGAYGDIERAIKELS